MAPRTLDDIRQATEHCYAAMEALSEGLSDADWQAQSLCPDWTVRQVFDHVVSIEAVLAGWWPDTVEQLPPFERAAEFVADPTPYPDKMRGSSTCAGVIWRR